MSDGQDWQSTLDPGIHALILALNEEGFVTTDGGNGPHITIACQDVEELADQADRLDWYFQDNGMLNWRIEAIYYPHSGDCVILAYEEVKA